MGTTFEPFEVRLVEVDDILTVTAEFRGTPVPETLKDGFAQLTPQEINQARDWLARGFIDRPYARDFGARLFDTLFVGEIRAAFRVAYQQVAPKAGLRVMLDVPARYSSIPWELMYDARGIHGFLARSHTAPLVRYLGGPAPQSDMLVPGVLRVLVCIATPHDYPPISGSIEAEAIRAVLARRSLLVDNALFRLAPGLLESRLVPFLHRLFGRPVEIEVIEHTTRARLEQCMGQAAESQRGFHVVHLIGHGQMTENGGELLLEKEDGGSDVTPPEWFAEAVALPTVRLVVLNACETATRLDLFCGAAQEIAQRGVPAVIGMQVPILDRSAVRFAGALYDAWATGAPIEGALSSARRLFSEPTRGGAGDWGIPVLFMKPGDALQLSPPVWRTPQEQGLAALPVLPTPRQAGRNGGPADAERPPTGGTLSAPGPAGAPDAPDGTAGAATREAVMSMRVDSRDPLARLLVHVLKWDWPQLLLVAWLIYGPIEKLLLPFLGGYLHLNGPIRSWVPDLEALLTGFVEFPIFLGFYLWTGRGVGDVFASLLRNKCFTAVGEYQAFVERTRDSFNRWWWPALSALVAGLAVILAHFVLWGPQAVPPPWFGQQRPLARLVALALIGLVAYAAAQAVWREILAVSWLGRLLAEFRDGLTVHPYQADGSGGLGAIGHHAASLSSFVLALTLFSIMGSLLPSLRGSGPIVLRTWSPLVLVVWLLYGLLIPIYILLIWPVHKAMQRERAEQINRLSAEMDALWVLMDQAAGKDSEGFLSAKQQWDELRELQARLSEDYPTWPLRLRTLRQLQLSVLAPLLYTVISVLLEQIVRLTK